jgi:hypothetical protein
MMRKIIMTLLLFSAFGAFGQNVASKKTGKTIKPAVPINTRIKFLQSENEKLKKEIGSLRSELSDAIVKLDSLKNQTEANSNAITQTGNDLGIKIQQTGATSEQKISAVDQSLSNKSLYGIIAVLAAILISVLLYFLLSKRQKSDKLDIIDQLTKTKIFIEESLIKEFGRQAELIDTQIYVMEQKKGKMQINPNEVADHSLAIKVAREINLIERYVGLMDPKMKGFKQLVLSVGKLKGNLLANGYDMPELLGKQFNIGLNAIVTNTIADDNLEPGAEIISKVLIPQVKYNDTVIQTAHIELSIGE